MKKPFKISSQSLCNFTEAGVPFATMLAASLGISIAELQEKIKNGEIYVVCKKKSPFKKFISWIKRRGRSKSA